MDNLTWKVLSTKTVRKDEWIDFRSSRCELPNGSVIDPFYTYHKCNFCVIVATTETGEYICVRQYRLGVGAVLTEFPAGAIEAGEEPLHAAKRELLEETGYASDEWVPILKTAPNATIANNLAYCFAAGNCRKVSGQHLDETECVDSILIPEEDMRTLVTEDSFLQAVHVAAYYRALEVWKQDGKTESGGAREKAENGKAAGER